MSNRILLLDNISADATGPRLLVGTTSGVNFGCAFTSLGGGTLKVYELPTEDAPKPALPIYSTTTGEPKHLAVSRDSWLMAELSGATAPSGVTVWAVKL